jgi:hypothetical protein
MNPSACASFHAERFSRRDLLRVGGLGLLELTLPRLWQGQARAAEALSAYTGTGTRPKGRASTPAFWARSTIRFWCCVIPTPPIFPSRS